MRISDWSSDVCSSDLIGAAMQIAHHLGDRHRIAGIDLRLVLLSAPAPHGALGATAALQGGQGGIHHLAAGQLAQTGVGGLLDGHTQRHAVFFELDDDQVRSEEHTSELQSLMRISYAVFCLKKKNKLAI